MFKKKNNHRRKIHLITGKPVYCRCIGGFVSFCVFQSAAFRAWKKALLSQVKLFKAPVVQGTISIVQKTFLPTGVC